MVLIKHDEWNEHSECTQEECVICWKSRVEALIQVLRQAPEPTDNVYLIGNFVSKYKTWREAARKLVEEKC